MSTIHVTFLNYKEQGAQKQRFTTPSLTQPNDVLSIRDMLANHVRGLPISGREGVFLQDSDDDPDYFPDLHSMDLVEVMEQRDYYRNRVKLLQEELNTPPPSPPLKDVNDDKEDTSDKEVDPS